MSELDLKDYFITTHDSTAPVFRKKFIAANPQHAVLRICGLGICLAAVNGNPVSDEVLSPVQSDYHYRRLDDLSYPVLNDSSYSTYYTEHDIRHLLIEGENEITVLVGNGWYHQAQRFDEGNFDYGMPKLSAVIDLGNEQIVTDLSWEYKNSSILENNMYYGEVFDASFCDNVWKKPIKAANFDTVMRKQQCPPNRVIRKIKPVKMGDTLYDMGENNTGWAKIVTSAPRGEKIVITFAEEIKDGKLDFASAGGDKQIQQDVYISSGARNQIYAPSLVYHAFRYFTVEGEISDVECEIVHSDVMLLPVKFNTDNKTLLWVVDSFIRSRLSTFQCGVPLDCPQRERLGYTGDGLVTFLAAAYLMDVNSFYKKWIRDIADCQSISTGHVKHTAPFSGGGGGPGWGSAMVIVPYLHYKVYGDMSVLSDYYINMEKWMKYLASRCEDGIVTHEEPDGWCLGDWCNPGSVEISPEYVNTYFYAKCADCMTEISLWLSKEEKAEEYRKLALEIKKEIKKHFYNETENTFDKGIQGSCAFAYDLGIASEADINVCLSQYKKSRHFDTGIFGTPLLLRMMKETGEKELAVDMICNETFPSYEYMRKNGATTLWETWEGKWSHNHPMFGGVVEFIVETFAQSQPHIF